MRHIRIISLLIFVAGIALVIVSQVADLGPTGTLVGLLLVIAGIVKIITVRIWHGFFEVEAPVSSLKGTPSHE